MVKYFNLKLLKSNIDSLFAALIGFVLVILLTSHSGLGISPDSIYYMSTADSFLAGKGFYQFDNMPFVMFPVFYPITLSLVKLVFGVLFLKVMPIFNAILFGITIFISGLILEQSNHTKWLKWLVLLIISSSPGLLEVYTMLWSETLFITEVIIFMYCSKLYFEKLTIKHLLIMALISAITAETRLAGVSILATGGLLILLNRNLKWEKKFTHALVYGLISISLFVINLLRNASLTQTLTGNRQKGVTPFLVNLKYYGLVLSDWLPFSNHTGAYSIILGFLFLTIIGFVFLYRLWSAKEHHTYEKIAVGFTLMYSFFMLAVATLSRFETINNRLLSPFYIPCILTISFYLASILRLALTKKVRIAFTLLFLLVSFATISQYANAYHVTYLENKEGGIGGYSDDDWMVNSGLLNYLNTNPSFFKEDKTIYSNAAHAVYFRTQQHVQILPERKYQHLVNEFNEMPSQLLIWFNNEDNPEVLTLQEVASTKNLQIIGKFNDGVIYQCTSK